jgi:hypothetical protein
MSLHTPPRSLRITGTPGPSPAQAPDGRDPWLTRHRPMSALGRVQCANCHWPYPCPARLAHGTR